MRFSNEKKFEAKYSIARSFRVRSFIDLWYRVDGSLQHFYDRKIDLRNNAVIGGNLEFGIGWGES